MGLEVEMWRWWILIKAPEDGRVGPRKRKGKRGQVRDKPGSGEDKAAKAQRKGCSKGRT
jgi:hypothetical protein